MTTTTTTTRNVPKRDGKAHPVLEPTGEPALVTALRRVDPLLQFLTKATGQTEIPLPTLRRSLPAGYDATALLQQLQALHDRGILQFTYRRCDEQHLGDSASTTTVATTDPTTTTSPTSVTMEVGSTFTRTTTTTTIRPTLQWEDATIWIGFPPPLTAHAVVDKLHTARRGLGTLHGSTSTAARRRIVALQRILQHEATHGSDPAPVPTESSLPSPPPAGNKAWQPEPHPEDSDNDTEEPIQRDAKLARPALQKLLGLQGCRQTEPTLDKDALPVSILAAQASYAGSHASQEAAFAVLPKHTAAQIPNSLKRVFGLPVPIQGIQGTKQLYTHQAAAIASILAGTHTSVCTGTGSGKSLCFLLPTLTAAYHGHGVSLLLFPTKALAQDQLAKLTKLLQSDADLASRIRVATLDGDTAHANRAEIAQSCNVILTNPDTLHAAVLPHWKTTYGTMLSAVRFVVIDEAHMYEGAFGAHVALVLGRLARISLVAAAAVSQDYGTATAAPLRPPVFVSTSATLPWPEQHFRLLCPISSTDSVAVFTAEKDGSPRSAKHFWVWNPPILHQDGTSTGKVRFLPTHPPASMTPDEQPKASLVGKKRPRTQRNTRISSTNQAKVKSNHHGYDPQLQAFGHGPARLHRRHAADETALLLAQAVANGIRCIAFCKTRNLVEWVFERALTILQKEDSTRSLASKVESYRGGYSMLERRQIEQRLFRTELLGVVGTNALELGVDIGGIDLTLHCGYPSSYASLLQQAGRAGRGGTARLNVPSCAVVVCFNSPSEQHIWRHPKTLLSKGVSAPHTIPINSGLVQGHLLCASEEFPLTGKYTPTTIQSTAEAAKVHHDLLNDYDLFGGMDIYEEALDALRSTGSVTEEIIATPAASFGKITIYKAHPLMKKAWSRVSIRSIEPVNYAVVDISHPGQGGRTNGIHDEGAVMDTLPYSRIFYHAHPGAIITHRGRKYKVLSMTRPPAFTPENFSYGRSMSLAAFAKPTGAKYSTRPLSNMHITVVKQMERIQLEPNSSFVTRDSFGAKSVDFSYELEQADSLSSSIPSKQSNQKQEESDEAGLSLTLAGYGIVNVKRSVHGYKKLSLITRAELSRTELSLPELEFESFGVWFDTDAGALTPRLGETYGPGVHALSHAILAVAPLFAPGLVRSDLECDHSFFAPTQVMLFDERAGGSGSSERLWNYFFQPNSILDAAIKLLEECYSCCWDKTYDGGCPACLHASNCIKFNMSLSRSAAIVIGKHMLERIQSTDFYRRNADAAKSLGRTTCEAGASPRRIARKKALDKAKEMQSSKDRHFVVGRVSWPLDGDEMQCKQVKDS
jgi:DEAD/DEAH box helicase domain-containing protein